MGFGVSLIADVSDFWICKSNTAVFCEREELDSHTLVLSHLFLDTNSATIGFMETVGRADFALSGCMSSPMLTVGLSR